MTVKVTVFCDVTLYSLVKSTEISECLAVCMARVDLQNLGSSEASIQLYHTTRRRVQVESDLHLVDRSRLPSACEKLLGMNSLSVYLSLFRYLFPYLFALVFVRTEYGNSMSFRNLCTHESVEAQCRDTEDSVRNVGAAKIPRTIFAYQS